MPSPLRPLSGAAATPETDKPSAKSEVQRSESSPTQVERTPRVQIPLDTWNGPVAAAPSPPATVSRSFGMAADNAPIRFRGASKYEGARLNAAALKAYAKMPSMEKFGSTDVELPLPNGMTRRFTVKDMQYTLADGSVGMRLIPVGDKVPARSAQIDTAIYDALKIPNSKRGRVSGQVPPFSLISYIHPEQWAGDLKQLALRFVKPEMGQTHLGMYMGRGEALNAPNDYHGGTWQTKGYPANVITVTLKGENPVEVTKSLNAAARVLNPDVLFPQDYKNDTVRTIDLNTTFQFYRDWLLGEQYLRKDPTWETYCSEHVSIVLNVGLNLPHNRKAFIEVFGEVDGPKAWNAFKKRFEKSTGRAFTTADESHFEPLWRKEGLSVEQVRPLSKFEYDELSAARDSGVLAAGFFWGRQTLPIGKAMVWAPQTVADLVKNFLETYAPFDEVGGYTSAAVLVGFKDRINWQLSLPPGQFMTIALPVLRKLMIAEARARAPGDAAGFAKWRAQAADGLYIVLGGSKEDFATGNLKPELMELVQDIMQPLARTDGLMLRDIAMASLLTSDVRNSAAYLWLRKAIDADIERARQLRTQDPHKATLYMPPAVVSRVINGIAPGNPHVELRIIATAVDASEVLD